MKNKPVEYIVIGSDNHWYGACFKSIKEAMIRIEEVKECPSDFEKDDAPESFYIYKGVNVKEVINEQYE